MITSVMGGLMTVEIQILDVVFPFYTAQFEKHDVDGLGFIIYECFFQFRI